MQIGSVVDVLRSYDRRGPVRSGAVALMLFPNELMSEGAQRVAEQIIQLYMAYAPAPPFNSGTPETASPAVLEEARRSAQAITTQRELTARQAARRFGIDLATPS